MLNVYSLKKYTTRKSQPLLILFLIPLSISATSQTEKIKHHLTSTPFATTLLAEQNKHLSTIAQYGFPAIVTIFSAKKKTWSQSAGDPSFK